MLVGIVSANSLLRQGVIAMLSAQLDVTLAWQAEEFPKAEDAAELPPADVLLLDADNDTLDRVLLERAQFQFPRSRVVVLYEFPSDELMVETLLAGARGCISKARDGDVLLKAIRCVARDELWANRRVTARALQKGTKMLNHQAQDSSQLSPREWEVFSLVALGKRNRQIAATLSISEHTVKRHLYSIYRKLNVPSRLEAGLLFYRMTSAAGGPALPAKHPGTPIAAAREVPHA